MRKGLINLGLPCRGGGAKGEENAKTVLLTRVAVSVTLAGMIVSFGNKETEGLWLTGKSRRLPPDVARRAFAKLQSLHVAETVEEFRVPPSNRLKKLIGDLKDFWSLRINDQWRILFRFEDGKAYDVEIIDYH